MRRCGWMAVLCALAGCSSGERGAGTPEWLEAWVDPPAAVEDSPPGQGGAVAAPVVLPVRSSRCDGEVVVLPPAPELRLSPASVQLRDGSVLITGGRIPVTATTSVVFDPATRTWRAGPSLVEPRGEHDSVLLTDVGVLIAGGFNPLNGHQLISAEIWEPGSGSFRATSSMIPSPALPWRPRLFLLPSGWVLAVDAQRLNAIGFSPMKGEVFDPLSETWMEVSDADVLAALVEIGEPHALSQSVSGYFSSGARAALSRDEVLVVTGRHTASFDVRTGQLLELTFAPAPVTDWGNQATSLVPLEGAGVLFDLMSGGNVIRFDPGSRDWTQPQRLGSDWGLSSFSVRQPLADGTALLAFALRSGSRTGYSVLYVPGAQRCSPAQLCGPGWRAAARAHVARVSATSARLADGRILVAGGRDTAPLASAELYDPHQDTWTRAADMHVARGIIEAVSLPDGRVVVAGQRTTTEPMSAELFDPATNAWTPLPALPATTSKCGGPIVQGDAVYLMVCAGSAPQLARWRTGDAAWSLVASPHGWENLAPLADGRVLGFGETIIHPDWGFPELLTSAATFDPVAQSWSAAGAMSQGRGRAPVAVLPDGRVLTVEGGTWSNRRSDLYDPDSGLWTNGSTAERRAGGSAAMTLLSDGSVLLAGGEDMNDGPMDPPAVDAELFDPVTGAWRSVPGPHRARVSGPVLQSLASGGALLTGGMGMTLEPLADTEIFVPDVCAQPN